MTFNYDRIRGFPDRRLLKWNIDYFNAFITADAAAMQNLQRGDFLITDIPLGLVKVDRDEWFNINTAFTANTYDMVCTALSLDGFYNPNKYSITILENHVSFKMKNDYPDNSGRHLPPNLKAGDSVAMIISSILWWDKTGKVVKDLEYGRVTWDTFSIDPWDKRAALSSASSTSYFDTDHFRLCLSDDDCSLTKEVLPGFKDEHKKRSVFARARKWIARIFHA